MGGIKISLIDSSTARESELKEELHELLKENRKLRLDIEELKGKKKPVKAKPKSYYYKKKFGKIQLVYVCINPAPCICMFNNRNIIIN